MILRSWFDVERILRQNTNNFTKLPPSMRRIDCAYDAAVEIGVTDDK